MPITVATPLLHLDPVYREQLVPLQVATLATFFAPPKIFLAAFRSGPASTVEQRSATTTNSADSLNSFIIFTFLGDRV